MIKSEVCGCYEIIYADAGGSWVSWTSESQSQSLPPRPSVSLTTEASTSFEWIKRHIHFYKEVFFFLPSSHRPLYNTLSYWLQSSFELPFGIFGFRLIDFNGMSKFLLFFHSKILQIIKTVETQLSNQNYTTPDDNQKYGRKYGQKMWDKFFTI